MDLGVRDGVDSDAGNVGVRNEITKVDAQRRPITKPGGIYI